MDESRLFSFLLVLVLTFFAGPLERQLALPGLGKVLPFVALTMLLGALSYSPQAVLRRNFEFRKLGLRALVSTTTGAIVSIAMAFLGYGVWSLITQALVVAFLNCLLVWRLSPWRPALEFSWADGSELARFGSKILTSKVLSFLASRGIEFVVVVRLSASALAIFIMGSRISALMMQLMSAAVVEVSLSNLSRLRGEPDRFRDAFHTALTMTASTVTPAFVLISAVSTELTTLIYGTNGIGSGAILGVTCLQSAVETLQFMCGTALVAMGRPGLSLALVAIKAAVVMTALSILPLESLFEMTLVSSLLLVILSPLSFLLVSRYTSVSLAKVGKSILPFLMAASFSYALVHFTRPFFEALSPNLVIRLGLLTFIGGVAYLLGALILDFRTSLSVWKALTNRKR